MKIQSLTFFLVGIFFLGANNVTLAQEQAVAHKRFSKADSAAINALVLYPDTIRLDIFEVCKYPEAIVRIANEQKNISSDFAGLVSSYPKNVQEDFWNLSRYPDLISKLVQGGKKPEEQINEIVASYPAEIRETAVKYGRDYSDVLKKIDDLETQTNAAFEQIIADYPPVTQEAFRELIQLPEVLSILNDHLDIAVLTGDRYKKDPQHVIHIADSLNMVITRQNAEEAQAWKDSIQQNPDAANDLKSAANDYAQEQGYSQDEIQVPANANVVINYTCYPYPYWFGYPAWYPYSYWYPYPFWFECGFYYDAFGNIVFIGIPSYNFTNWYFYYPEHWHHYPYLGGCYVNHYYGPRRAITGNTVIVHHWVRDNKPNLPHDFLTNRQTRVEAIKEMGQLHTDIQRQHPGTVTAAQRAQYLQTNPAKYPHLNATPQPKLLEPERQPIRVPDVIQPPVKQPPVHLPKPVQQEQRETPVVKPPSSPIYNYERINKAQDYHRNTWEQAPVVRPQPAPQRPQSPPPIRQAPAPTRQESAPVRQQPRK